MLDEDPRAPRSSAGQLSSQFGATVQHDAGRNGAISRGIGRLVVCQHHIFDGPPHPEVTEAPGLPCDARRLARACTGPSSGVSVWDLSALVSTVGHYTMAIHRVMKARARQRHRVEMGDRQADR